MKINQHHIAGVFKILFCILLLLMSFCCGYSQCHPAVNVALNETATASSPENACRSGLTDNGFARNIPVCILNK